MVISIAFQELSLSEEEGGTLKRGATTRLQYTFQNETNHNLTFRLCVTKGRIIIYASSIPNPGSAQYDERDELNHNPFFPITCLTKVYYQINDGNSNTFGGQTVGNNYQNGRCKRRQTTTEPEFAPAIYITLEGQDDINEFNFNSSEGSVAFGRCMLHQYIYMADIMCVHE